MTMPTAPQKLEDKYRALAPKPERIRMIPIKDDPSRREFLAVSAAGVAAGILTTGIIVETAEAVKEAFYSNPDGEIRSKKLADGVSKLMVGKGRLYINRIKPNMQRSVSGKTIDNRLEFATRIINDSDILPDFLKSILPCVPMQESKYANYVRSRTGATGIWQFMPETARRFPSRQDPLNGGRRSDRRREIKHATKAAVAYYEYIYKFLKKSEGYKKLNKRYDDKTMEEFLSLCTINGYQAGEGNLRAGIEMLANESELKDKADKTFRAEGGQGLYALLTKNLSKRKFRRKYARGYGKESKEYVYHILAYKLIHQAKRPYEDVTKRERTVDVKAGALSGAVTAAVGFGLIENKVEGKKLLDTKMNRRKLLGLAAAATAGAVGGVIESQAQLARRILNKK